MSKYKYIKDLEKESKAMKKLSLVCEFDKEIISLLKLLEKVNPCNAEYEYVNNNFIVSYKLKLNLLNFKKLFTLNAKAQIIGLPISLSKRGYYGKVNEIVEIIKKRKGLKIILNGDSEFKDGGRTLSTFILENSFSSFDEYLNSLRSPYRRRINEALSIRNRLEIKRIDKNEFSNDHYKLYLSIMSKTENPLETLEIEFFKEYDAELYEFRDNKTKEIKGFIQLKEINDKLYFLFGGFNREDIEYYDIYYNMLLKIVETGIEKKSKSIEFGQTAEESKLKIGCKEVPKFLYVHHSNPIINYILQALLPIFSYKPYNVKHHVFKRN